MPVWKATVKPRKVDRFDVCASYTETRDVLGHAMLCDLDTEWSVANRSIKSVHMGPPLLRNAEEVDLVGIVGLDADERGSIGTFVKDRRQERRARKARGECREIDGIDLDYIICPLIQPPTKDYASWRYSCVGFVLAAYDEAGVELIASEIPEVGMDRLRLAYPSVDQMTPAAKKEMGIGEGDAWPIVFVGYVMASLERSPIEIRQTPYVPNNGDEFFPRKIEMAGWAGNDIY